LGKQEAAEIGSGGFTELLGFSEPEGGSGRVTIVVQI
jgi:hypothetical protein